MTNRKVLIFHDKESLRPIGGPSGYLNSLSDGLGQIPEPTLEIHYLPRSEVSKKRPKLENGKIIERLKEWLRPLYGGLAHCKYINTILNTKINTSIDFNQYDAIHFHTTLDLYQSRDKLKDYKGKIILTSHSPEPLSMEIIEGGYDWDRKLFSSKYCKLIEMDRYSFNRADYIIFPCEASDEPYAHRWQEYESIKKKNINKYRYLLTGTIPATVKTGRHGLRKKYGIPEDAFVISYVGRHNEIKGYDLLRVVGDKVLNNYSDVYFLIAGAAQPLKGLDNRRWIEVGWTDEPHSITNASDIFILPNRETYFDLVLLEVLSLGKIVVASNTGGNKYFREQKGIMLYDNLSECYELLDSLHSSNSNVLNQLGLSNRNLYLAQFKTRIFAENYLRLLNSLI